MRKITNILIGIVVGMMLSIVPIFAQAIVGSINVKLNAVNVQLEGEPVEMENILYNGKTYLPMREVVELVGLDIEWEPTTMTANITKLKRENIVMGNSKIKIIDNEEYYSIRDVIDLTNEHRANISDYAQYSIWPNGGTKQDGYILTLSLFEGKLGRYEKRLIDSVPHITDKYTSYIKKDYYEQTILPLIQQ